ncbi:type 2 periplasmic-binding domain-containing protein [Pararhodospirillum oryzae]|uniref:Uncharacterized protein n=1 Tax=Pararhodospirillum oryzae TaxID=478448 RepID=A0A512H4T8_9PROT|nr:hypothetical protein [Pararhodospirillum oryzae]GEO80472.1 hypothetical protein ROR02_06030 [Pararhodospirillum oryzae]
MRHGPTQAGLQALGMLLGLGLGWTGFPLPLMAHTLKAAHGYEEGLRETRHRMLEVLARELAAREPSLRLKIYGRGRLFTPAEMWIGLMSGTLEVASLPLTTLRGVDPVFARPARPGLATTLEDAYGLAQGPLMRTVRETLARHGVRVLADLWLPGALIARDGSCAHRPADLAGKRFDPGGRPLGGVARAHGAVLQEADKAPVSGPSREPAAVEAVAELDILGGLPLPASACVTLPGPAAPWFEYHPVLMSEKTWAGLSERQQAAVMEAARSAETYARVALSRALAASEARLATAAREGARVEFFTPEEARAWIPPAPPVAPSPAEPAPGASAPVASAPVEPSPVEPAPVVPAPVAATLPPASGGEPRPTPEPSASGAAPAGAAGPSEPLSAPAPAPVASPVVSSAPDSSPGPGGDATPNASDFVPVAPQARSPSEPPAEVSPAVSEPKAETPGAVAPDTQPSAVPPPPRSESAPR